jgi:hypothetical protein
MNRKVGRKRIAGLGLLCVFLPAAALPASGLDLSFKLSGSYSFPVLNDVNRCLQAWVEFHKKDVAAVPGWTFSGGKAEKVRGGFDLEGEVLLNLTPRWAVGIGSGYSYAEVTESRSTIVTVEKRAVSFAYVRPTKVAATPLIISGYHFLPLGPKFQIYVRAGMGWLWAKYVNREGVKRATRRDFNYTSFQSASGRGALVQGGLGVKYIQDKSLGFFCEASLRQAKVNSLKGQNGELYFFEEYYSPLDFWWAKIETMEMAPAGENFRSARKAVVDLSGFILKLRFFIKF